MSKKISSSLIIIQKGESHAFKFVILDYIYGRSLRVYINNS